MAGVQSDKLLVRIQNDQASAFRLLFDEWYTPLCQHACTFVGDHQVAEDIVQELFINLWANRKKIRISVSVRSYLYRSVRNRCLNYIRDSGKIRIDRIDQLENYLEADQEPDKEEEELMRALHGQALEAVRELPERCRVIFNMSRNTDMTNKEIAQKLGLSEKTIENQITIALKKLRAYLGPQLDKLFFGVAGICMYFFWG